MFMDLPDPVRQAGTALAGVGGGLATIAGSGALALVGLSHVRQSMQSLNVSAKSLLRFGFHPITIGLGALAAVLLTVANRKAELRRRAETLSTILGDEARGVHNLANSYERLTEQQRRLMAEDILNEHEKLLPILEKTGATIDDVVRAKLGEREEKAVLRAPRSSLRACYCGRKTCPRAISRRAWNSGARCSGRRATAPSPRSASWAPPTTSPSARRSSASSKASSVSPRSAALASSSSETRRSVPPRRWAR
jgi:hypothetical protein